MDLREGLVAEYLFAGSAEDSGGAGHHGAVHGATLTSDRFGKPDSAYRFDGVDDYIEVSPPPGLSSDALSISVWACAEPRDFRGYTNSIVAQDDGNDEDQSRRVFQLSTEAGHIIWHRMIGSRDPMCRSRVRPGVWQHFVAVHDHGVNHLFVDGILHDSVEHKLWTHASQPMHIGRKGTDEQHFFFKGAIDDVRIYNRALGNDDVQVLLGEGGWSPTVRAPVDGDPLSGRWGQDGVVFLHLRYDGAERITGRIMGGRPDNMAAISKGTFDRATGRLRLEGDARDPRDGSPVKWLIEGMLDDSEICVCARFNDFSGNFILTPRGARLRATRRSIRSQLGALGFTLRNSFSSGASR